MALILSGDAGITFPVTAGSASAVQASSGRVLQVVQGTTSSTTTTTGATPVATNLTASITPSSSSSKILIISTFSIYTTNLNTKVYTSLYRNSTNISAAAGGAYFYNAGGGGQITTSINLLDSPATTSATSYTIYLFGSATANSVSFNADTMNNQIILMEIAA